MKNDLYHWAIKSASLLLFTTAVSAEQNNDIYQDSTNRLSLSLQFGLNISAKFKGIGGSLNPSYHNPNPRRTPQGDAYNYDDGYVLTDISGNAGGQSWYWGYDNASQVSGNTISFDHSTAAANASSSSGRADSSTNPGFELDYERQLGTKDNWHNLRYGLDSAVNFVPISINNSSAFGATVTKQTDVYSFTPGTTPPTAPYQGSFQGPGFVINVPRTSTTTTLYPNATVSSQDHFSANLWGFHLGPYVEIPFGEKEQFTLSLVGGFAFGLLSANDSWKQTVAVPGNNNISSQGGGDDVGFLWGGYVGLGADYQISDHWGIVGGVQFQDLGTYDRNFGGREVNLDLSKSLLVQVGISYNF